MRVVSIGEILWDIHGDEEYIGGAPYNFSAHLRRLGHEVYFISALGKDPRGDKAFQMMRDSDLSTKFVGQNKTHPTGFVDITLDVHDSPSFVIHRPAAYDFPSLSEKEIEDIKSLEPKWLYFGTMPQMSSVSRDLTAKLRHALPHTKCFYDINMRTGHYRAELIEELLQAASILKINRDEVTLCCSLFHREPMELNEFAAWVVSHYGLDGVFITMAEAGCMAYIEGQVIESPGYTVEVADPVGAGDAFAAAVLHGMNKEWPLHQTCNFANQLGAYVASKKGAVPSWTPKDIHNLSVMHDTYSHKE